MFRTYMEKETFAPLVAEFRNGIGSGRTNYNKTRLYDHFVDLVVYGMLAAEWTPSRTDGTL